MKRIIILLFLFFNLMPVIEKGKLTINGPQSIMAQSNSEENDNDPFGDFFNDYSTYNGPGMFDDGYGIPYSYMDPETYLFNQPDGSLLTNLIMPTNYLFGGGAFFLDYYDFSFLGISNVSSSYTDPTWCIILPEVTITAKAESLQAFFDFKNLLDAFANNLYYYWEDQYSIDPINILPPPSNPPEPISIVDPVTPVDPCGSESKQVGSTASTFLNYPMLESGTDFIRQKWTTNGPEWGFATTYNDGVNTTIYSFEMGDATHVDIPAPFTSVFMEHLHTDGSPPSAEDCFGITRMDSVNFAHTGAHNYLGGAIIGEHPENDYYVGIVDHDMAASFQSKKTDWYNPSSQSFLTNSTIGADYYAAISQLTIQGNSNPEEGALSFVLGKYNTGLILYKRDSNGNFAPISTSKDSNYLFSSSICN